MIKEEFRNIDNSDLAVKKTGMAVGIVLIIISIVLWKFEKTSFMYFSFAGGLLVVLAFIALPVLRPFHRLWMMLAVLLGFIMSRVILSILFYLILTPIGLIAKISGKIFMPLSFDKSASTYWEKRSTTQKQKIDYERQF